MLVRRRAGCTSQARDAAESLGQRARVVVVFGEPIDHRGQRDNPGRRDYPRLAHPAAEHLAHAARPFHERARRRRASCPTGQASPLERQNETVSACAAIRLALVSSASAALKMRAPSRWTREAVAMRQFGDRGHVRKPDRLAAAAVVRVFHRDQRGRREMRIGRRLELAFELVEREFAVVGIADRSEHHAAQRGRATRLVKIGVGARAEHRLGAARAMHQHRDQIAHRAAGDQQRGFLAHRVRRHRLEPIDGGVLAVNVVAQLGARDRLAHLGRRQGDGVAAQIDHVSRPPTRGRSL